MAIPDFQTLMLPVLREAAAGEVRIGDVVDRLSVQFKLTNEERSHLLPSGRQTTFANRVHWAKSYLGKAGLVDLTRRAHFKITSRGHEVLSRAPARSDINFLKRFPEFQAFRVTQNGDDEQANAIAEASATTAVLTPDEVMRAAGRQLEGALAGELLQRVMAGTPAFFESLVVRLLIAMGYGGSINELDRALVGRSGDGGVDGVIDQDPLGLDRIYVQAKRYAEDNSVGASSVRDFF